MTTTAMVVWQTPENRQRRAWIAALMLAAACARAHPTPSAALANDHDDQLLFGLVVDQMVKTYGLDLTMTPWPLDGNDLGEVGRRSPPARLADARRHLLMDRHVPIIEDASTGKCPSGYPAAVPQPGCPKTTGLRVIVGIVRLGGPYWASIVDERESGAAKGERVMRVLVQNLTPGGYTSMYFDYVFARTGSSWAVVQVRALMMSP